MNKVSVVFSFLLILGISGASASERFVIRHRDFSHMKSHFQKRAFSASMLKQMRSFNALVVEGDALELMAFARSTGASIEPDYVHHIVDNSGHFRWGMGKPAPAPTPVPPAQIVPWGISKIRAQQSGVRGEGVIVCVSDTGIDLTHPDLSGNIIANFNAISTKSGTDDNGHGTHVAGIIAALDNAIGVVGVAPQAKLIAAKGLDRRGSGFSSDLAETIDGCRERGAQVINMSWGSSSPSSIIHDALIRAAAENILLIAASGNEGGPVIYPAAFSEVVAVGATDQNDDIAYFSNYGPEVESSAPGVNIYSTYAGGGYRTLSGTSMATPHVSGVAALMRSFNPSATRDGLVGVDIGEPLTKQGTRGRIDAVLSAP